MYSLKKSDCHDIEYWKNLHFSEVKTANEMAKIVDLRLKVYKETNPYMLKEMVRGRDTYDEQSYIYAAWFNHTPIATVRLTPYPFETLNYINELTLSRFLGKDYKKTHLEWSRLVVDHHIKINRIMPALILYAGINILFKTSYKKYFGYTTPIVRRLMNRFNISNETVEFTIPSRERNHYQLLKGEFLKNFFEYIK